jgi:hypothetical protein
MLHTLPEDESLSNGAIRITGISFRHARGTIELSLYTIWCTGSNILPFISKATYFAFFLQNNTFLLVLLLI